MTDESTSSQLEQGEVSGSACKAEENEALKVEELSKGVELREEKLKENGHKHFALAPKQEQSNNSEACDFTHIDYLGGPSVVSEFSWMDYLGEQSGIDDAANTNDDAWGDSLVQTSAHDPISHGENDLNSSLEVQIDVSLKGPVESTDSSAEISSSNDVSSHAQDSGVILLRYEELNPDTEEAITVFSCSQHPENISSPVSYSNSPPVPLSEQSEADFDGFGDLFNEPEVTSELKTDTGIGGRADLNFWAGNSSESNQEEVDNSNAPVSIQSCLALFTKPELLCGEHAWYCDHCSEILSPQGTRDKIPSTTGVQLEEKKPQIDRKCKGKSNSSNVLVDCLRPASSKTSDDAEMTSVSTKDDSHAERPDEKSINTVGSLEDIKCEDGEKNDEETLDFPGSLLSDQVLKSGVLEDSESADLRSGTATLQDCSNINSIIRGSKNIDSSEQACACVSHQGPTQTGLSGSIKKDKLEVTIKKDKLEVNHLQRNGEKLLARGRPVKGNRFKEDDKEKNKVKRDATKRYLISKAPSILTIHLKRFSQDARGRLTKLRGHIGFQEILDLRPYLDPRCESRDKCIYRLIGVVEHSGNMGGGHYVAYVRGEHHGLKTQKDANSASWFYASDAHVRQTSLSEVLQSDAYLLFYERV